MNMGRGKQTACSLRRRSAKTVGLPCESALFRLLLPAYQPATPQRRPPAAAAASTLICGSRMILPSDGLRFLTSCKRAQTSRSQPLLLRATSSVPRSCPCQIGSSGTAQCGFWDFRSSLAEGSTSICRGGSSAISWSDSLFSCPVCCIPSFVLEMRTKNSQCSKGLCFGTCGPRRAARFVTEALQVLGEVQPLDLYFRLGGQLLLDALLLHCPGRQVSGIQDLHHHCISHALIVDTRATCTPSP
jgi:hypothetical protein